jgi:hypothetical protein
MNVYLLAMLDVLKMKDNFRNQVVCRDYVRLQKAYRNRINNNIGLANSLQSNHLSTLNKRVLPHY